MDDNTLMCEVRSGDIDRLGLLYEKYKKALFSYFFKVTKGDHAGAEDLVHIVFQRVLKYKDRFDGTGSFVSWLFSIARNCGIDYHRKKHFKYSIDQYPNYLIGDDDSDSELLRTEQIDVLYHALNLLEPTDKEILILGKIDELKYKDIADILDCSECAVRVRIFRALKRLKDVYLKLEPVEK